ncbi:MAG: YncE family protein, partial [Bacteroidia bacterium]
VLASIEANRVHGITLAADLNKGYISNGKDSSVTVFDLSTLKILSVIKTKGANPDAILYDAFSKQVFVFNGRSKNATVIDAKTDLVIETIVLSGKPEFSVSNENGKIYVNIEDKNEITVINATTLKVEQVWSIAPGEEPTGLAIDNKTHCLFSVCGNKLMMVVNAETGKVITSLPIGDGCDGVAFDAELKRAYSSNGEGTVTVVQEEDGNKFKVMETIKTEKWARTITVNPKTHHVFLPVAERGDEPKPTAENPHPRAAMKPNSFLILELAQTTK